MDTLPSFVRHRRYVTLRGSDKKIRKRVPWQDVVRGAEEPFTGQRRGAPNGLSLVAHPLPFFNAVSQHNGRPWTVLRLYHAMRARPWNALTPPPPPLRGPSNLSRPHGFEYQIRCLEMTQICCNSVSGIQIHGLSKAQIILCGGKIFNMGVFTYGLFCRCQSIIVREL